MELKFVQPLLRDLDSVGSEVLACGVFEDERPVRGVAGLVDWRLVLQLSRYMQAGTITGGEGETVMLRGRPRLPYDKIILFGLGLSSQFDEHVYKRAIEKMLSTLGDLKVRIAVVERPGRHLGKLPPEYAIDTLLETCEQMGDQDTWALVEELSDHKMLTEHLDSRRRHQRMR